MQKRVVVVCGQTATGKTAAALKLSRDFSGDVISIDSRQAYKYMDIGTGKDLPANSNFHLVSQKSIGDQIYDIGYYSYDNIRLWLYDCLTPDQQVNVAHIALLAHSVIDEVQRLNRLPILVGGDGFYLQNIIHPAKTLDIPPNHELRNNLESLSLESLQEILIEVDPLKWHQMNNSDRHNPRRIVRAIEVGEYLLSQSDKPEVVNPKISHDIWIGLKISKDSLNQKIRLRVMERVNQGFHKEIEKLLSLYPDFFSLPSSITLGYAQWRQVIEGNLNPSQAIHLWIQSEVSYAKRQQTWFKKNQSISWFDIQSNSWYAQAREQVDQQIIGNSYGQ